MIPKEKQWEKKIHKLNKRLKRLEGCPQAFTNYQRLHDIVMRKLDTYNKLSRGK